ncbi:hypothetical protein JCM6882_003044 [Rhodosporidiobolus microsporus]
MHPTLLLSLSLVTLTVPSLARPTASRLEKRCGTAPCDPPSSCSASALFPEFPQGNTQLSVPEGARTVAVALAFGAQTYACLSAGSTPVRTALASLYDVSPVLLAVPDPGVAKYQLVSHAYIFQALNPAYTVYGLNDSSFIGTHSFVAVSNLTDGGDNGDGENGGPSPPCAPDPRDPLTSLLPHFSLSRTTCPHSVPGAVTARQVATTPSPLSPPGANLDWAQAEVLDGVVEGDTGFSRWVFRTDVQGGAQPRECHSANQVDTVQYGALYWFLR